MNKTITKVSDTKFEIREIIPEKVIPQEEKVTTATIAELKASIANFQNAIAINIIYKKIPQAELDKLDRDIADLQEQIDEAQGYIDQAVNKGVVEVTP